MQTPMTGKKKKKTIKSVGYGHLRILGLDGNSGATFVSRLCISPAGLCHLVSI